MRKTGVLQKKANIPRALREQVWIQNIGSHFQHKCLNLSWHAY